MRLLHRTRHAERGDTLVEVSIALAILAMVLVSAYNLANLSFRQGQAAKERTQAADFIQEQAEALRNYRDSHPWAQFLSDTAPGAPATFHMSQSGSTWTVASGGVTPPINGQPSLYTLTISRTTVVANEKYQFDISADWPSNLGGPPNHTQITTYLINPSLVFAGPTTTGSTPGRVPALPPIAAGGGYLTMRRLG
jgi:prepilin-type N-terminal cleavage/methylation domain-containing protein